MWAGRTAQAVCAGQDCGLCCVHKGGVWALPPSPPSQWAHSINLKKLFVGLMNRQGVLSRYPRSLFLRRFTPRFFFFFYLRVLFTGLSFFKKNFHVSLAWHSPSPRITPYRAESRRVGEGWEIPESFRLGTPRPSMCFSCWNALRC